MYRIYVINFLLATSTTIGMTIIPFLITDSLGLSLLILGLLEGSSEFLSNVFRLVNGILFDKIKNKRLIFITSTGLAFSSKAILLLPSALGILLSKIMERIANGIFASPRDAYVASNAKNKGMALGLLNISKTLGCVLGPLLVSSSTLILGNLKENLHIFVALCCCLAVIACLLSMTLKIGKLKETPFSLSEMNNIFKKITPILFIAFLFFLGRFNDGLIMIYLKKQNYPEWFYLSSIAIFNVIMLIVSPIIGRQIDKNHLKQLLFATAISLGIFNICFYQLDYFKWIFAVLGLCAWGIQRASAQIVFSAFIFKSVDKENYGTAIGLYYICSGLATMLASFVCGYIANTHFIYIFILSGFFAFTALGVSWHFLNKIMLPINQVEAYA